MSTFYKLIFIAFGLLSCDCEYSDFCDADSTDCRQTDSSSEDLWGTMFVAAIDFGTTFSGWAFLYKEEYNKDPTSVVCKTWPGGGYSSLKAPTTVLIEPDGKTFLAFGYDAETKYAKLAATKKHQNYYYFRRFKMLLDGSQAITWTTTIKDNQGHVLPAITVFALVIQHLKQDLQRYWLDHGLKVDDSEIRWVLTVPAIWDDKAKQFMKEAAVQGGIDDKNLLIALEPEAASLYSRLVPVEKMEDESGSFISSLKTGAKYMIIDAGGGTADITVHEVLHNKRLKELHKADGGPWGGTKVDSSFTNMLELTVGVDVFQEFRKVCAYEYLELFRDFEVKKRDITPENDDEMIIRYSQCLAKVVHEVTGETLYDKISSSPFKEHLKVTLDHVLISADIARGFFQEALDSITEKVAYLLKDPKLSGVESILLVGGFAESQMLQHAIRSNFPNLKVFIPKNAGLVVLKGAVIFGFNPSAIVVRVCKFTYGVAYVREGPFIEGECDEDKVQEGDCVDLFKQFVKIGDEIRIDDTQGNISFIPRYEHLEEVDIPVYACDQDSPVYVTDKGCLNLGYVTVKIRDRTVPREERKLLVAFFFSGTSIKVSAIEARTGEETTAVVNFLG